ncbi:MAG: DUF397 domain-containing protein [Streptosporangiaceae bacterium]
MTTSNATGPASRRSTGNGVAIAVRRQSDHPGLCVEVTAPPTARISPGGPALRLTPASWLSLVDDIKFGALD